MSARRIGAVGAALFGAFAILLWCGMARADGVRILVAAGHRFGLAAETPLKYADNDATRVRDVMTGFGGVRGDRAFLLAEPTRADLFAALDRAHVEAAKHPAGDVTFVFYFSGHGDREAIHLGDERVLLADLQGKLAEIPAALRIAVTDACRTTREKGFVADEPFAISATSSTQATGQVWLHASSDGEAAQESDELQGAIFTHAWLNGLRGAADANGDASVTLDESFAFAHSQTLIRSARSSGVVQKPEAIVALRELAPVVLTQTAAQLAKLSIPPARDAHFLVYAAGARSVFAELWGAPDRRIELAVPPGRYVVQRRISGIAASGGVAATPSVASIAQVAVGAGEERTIGERDFAPSSLEMLARKGALDGEMPAASAAPRPPHSELAVAYEAGGDSRTGLVQGPRATYTRVVSRVAVSVGAAADFGGRTLPTTTENVATTFGRAAVEYRAPLGGAVTARIGAGARAGWMIQTLRPNAAVSSLPTSSGAAPTHATNGAFVGGPEIFVALRVLEGARFFADVGATGSVVFLREEAKMRGVAGLSGGASLGASF